MDNKSALRGLCNALCNTFYPDNAAIEVMLFNEGIQACDDARPKDVSLLKLAIKLVMGYCETSRTETMVLTLTNMSRTFIRLKTVPTFGKNGNEDKRTNVYPGRQEWRGV